MLFFPSHSLFEGVGGPVKPICVVFSPLVFRNFLDYCLCARVFLRLGRVHVIINQMSSLESVAELRLKIKKLKYKLEKEQNITASLRQDIDRYHAIANTQTSMERVFKKISFLLTLKGMTITDWVNSIPYDDSSASKKEVRIDDLVTTLQAIGIKLQAAQKSILLNYCSDSMSEVTSLQEVVRRGQQCGVQTG